MVWNPYTKGYFDNPYDHIQDCRHQNPIQIGVHKEWVLFKHKDVKRILKSESFGTSNLSQYLASKEKLILGESVCPYLSKGTQKWVMYLDGTEHFDITEFADQALRKFDSVAAIERAIDRCLSENRGFKKLDLVDLATQIPLYVTEEMMGITGMFSYEKLKEFSHLLAISQDLFISKTTYQAINQEFDWAFEFFTRLYENAKEKPNNSVVSHLYEQNVSRSVKYSSAEIVSLLTVLFMAALETSKDTISMVLLKIMEDDSLSDYIVKANEKEINVLVEELFRVASPLQYTIRTAFEDYDLDGQIFPKGTRLFLCLASANRDEEVFEKSNSIVPDRSMNPHLSFGMGKHSCLGARIARIELRTWLKPLTIFLRNYQLSDAVPVWQKTIFMRGLKSVIVHTR
jgi:cytochrome P450